MGGGVIVSAKQNVKVPSARAHGSAGTQCAVGHGYMSNLRAMRMSVCVHVSARVHLCECARSHRCVCVAQSFFMDRGLKRACSGWRFDQFEATMHV